jgi:hypothetical protein
VPIARDHLRRGHRAEPELPADVLLDERVDVGIGADGARELADRDRVAGALQAIEVTAHLHGPERELRAERRRFGVDAVRAPDHRRVAELARPTRDRRLQASRRTEDHVHGSRELQRQRGVDDVARRQPVVHPRARRLPDALLHDVDERGDVVIGGAFPLVHRLDVEAGPFANGAGVGLGDHTELRPCFDGEDLDFEPRSETGLVGEEVGDLGERVARDHWWSVTAASAMSRR